MLAPYVESLIDWIAANSPQDWATRHHLFLYSALAIMLVGVICGAIGTIVVANRMAFFSDALAHSAFAGMAIALVIFVLAGLSMTEFVRIVPFILVGFGVVFGLLIAFVRENTSLSSDTVIGVFFAFALGLGGMMMKAVEGRRVVSLENFLFGDTVSIGPADIEMLLYLTVVAAVFLCLLYNSIVFTSFNASLARSRGIRTRLALYSFIILLGVTEILCMRIVGVLLINGLLIVPAASAAIVSKNMRQMFWISIISTVFAGWTGMLLAWEIELPDPVNPRRTVHFGAAGTILVLSVLLFFAAMAWRKIRHPLRVALFPVRPATPPDTHS